MSMNRSTRKIFTAMLAVDGWRYEHLLESIDFKDECLSCRSFDRSLPVGQSYRCAVGGSCIAATIHPNVLNHLRRSVKLDPDDV